MGVVAVKCMLLLPKGCNCCQEDVRVDVVGK